MTSNTSSGESDKKPTWDEPKVGATASSITQVGESEWLDEILNAVLLYGIRLGNEQKPIHEPPTTMTVPEAKAAILAGIQLGGAVRKTQ